MKSISEKAFKQRRIEDAELPDAFLIRNLFDDEGLRAFVTSPALDEKLRKDLNDMEAMVIDEQPAFPPVCYALLQAAGR